MNILPPNFPHCFPQKQISSYRFGTKRGLINNDRFYTTKEVPIHKIQKYKLIIYSTAFITFINIPSEIPETAEKKTTLHFQHYWPPNFYIKKTCLHYSDLFISQIKFFFLLFICYRPTLQQRSLSTERHSK